MGRGPGMPRVEQSAEEEPWEEMRFLSRQQALQHSWGSMQLLPGVLKE